MEDILPQILELWHTNNRINLFLIDQISDEGMLCTLSKRGGRNVVRQFAHLHNMRWWHLDNRAKDLCTGLYKFKTGEEPNREHLKECLTESAGRIASFIERCVHGTDKARAFKKGIIPYVGYFVAHESHHRGSILLTLKQCGHKLDNKIQYAIWNWERI